MAVRVKIARATAEIDELFQLRHRVFVEEEGYLRPRPDGRIADRFDAYPTTANLVALVADRLVGALRVVEHSEAGMPTDEFYDFRTHLSAGFARVCSGSMFCVERARRDTPRLVFGLLGMAYHWARYHGMTHMLGAVNPDIESFFIRAGGRRIAKPVRNEELGLGAVPMLFGLNELPGGYPAFLERQCSAPYLESFDRVFLERGQLLRHTGETSRIAYVVLDGRVSVERRIRGPQRPRRVAEFARGQLCRAADLPPAAQLRALSQCDLMTLRLET
jgi:N-acyl-L-homoserine lactone synthetase